MWHVWWECQIKAIQEIQLLAYDITHLGSCRTCRQEEDSTFYNERDTRMLFSRWDGGCHTRMNDVWIADRAITVDELLKLQEVWEEDWNSPLGTDRWKLQVGLLAMAATFAFSGALRGEERFENTCDKV
jgi:hypothetical protein